MESATVALVSVACIFGGALLGIRLQKHLPGHHLGKESQDVIKLIAGVIATLTALVLSLLITSAKNAFDAMSAGIVQGSAKIILLDRSLAHYGPEAKAAREQLRSAIAAGIEKTWPNEKTGAPFMSAFESANGMELVQEKLRELAPQTDAQRQILAQAQQIAGDLAQTRWLLIEQGQNRLPSPVLFVLICWLTLLFTSFGLFSPRNVTVLTVLFVGACSVSAAIFLVMELSRPQEGFIRLSSAPLRNALEHLGK